jgi:hypothetical protein
MAKRVVEARAPLTQIGHGLELSSDPLTVKIVWL